ncbi:molybdenum cofactor guanylyltransferase [Alkalicoccus urumqiensis]|nr:molybdenum cofactor guanylyltransferase [Alkalicoccus urumqiensis]
MKRYGTAGLVMAGGRSSRMGGDKALLPVGEKTAAARTADMASAVCDIVVVITNSDETAESLSYVSVNDLRPYEGPLAGIEAGMSAVEAEWYLVCACDMPLAEEKAASILINEAEKTGADAVIPVIDGRQQPLFAVYSRRVLPEISRCLDREERSMKALFRSIHVTEAQEPLFLESGMTKEALSLLFYNMNRPEEYDWIISRMT